MKHRRPLGLDASAGDHFSTRYDFASERILYCHRENCHETDSTLIEGTRLFVRPRLKRDLKILQLTLVAGDFHHPWIQPASTRNPFLDATQRFGEIGPLILTVMRNAGLRYWPFMIVVCGAPS